MSVNLTTGHIQCGWVQVVEGRTEEGIAHLHAALEAKRVARGCGLGRLWYSACLAEAHELAGQPKEGLPLAAESLDVVSKTGEFSNRGRGTVAQTGAGRIGRFSRTIL